MCRCKRTRLIWADSLSVDRSGRTKPSNSALPRSLRQAGSDGIGLTVPTPSVGKRGLRDAASPDTIYMYEVVAHLMYTASGSGSCAVLAAAHALLAWLPNLGTHATAANVTELSDAHHWGELARVMYSSAQRKSELDKPKFTLSAWDPRGYFVLLPLARTASA